MRVDQAWVMIASEVQMPQDTAVLQQPMKESTYLFI
jgi:hypothetical protein